MQYKDEDLIGKRFGRLTVISVFKKNRKWCHCKCDCGKEKDIRLDCLIGDKCHSCGCLNLEAIKTHGYSKHKLYNSFYRIIKRCTDKSNKDYKYYGARGIKICDEWRCDPKMFVEYCLENGWKEGLTIDRIDVNGNYEPTNCRWITKTEQQFNKTNTRYFEYKGQKKCLAEWAEIFDINKPTLYNRVYNLGWNIEKALETEVKQRKWSTETF